MKKLILVSGTMGVGKTTTCRLLYKMAPRTAWLDGDWCWLMNPWNFCDENKEMVMSNITGVLGSFLSNSTLDNVVFSWVMHKKEIIDDLLGRISKHEFELHLFALVCSPVELSSRMEEDERDAQNIKASIDRLPLYQGMGWEVLDTTCMKAKEVAIEIAKRSGLVK
ncbi:MAG TPA: AAA family ATPase [Bacillota bacterium]|nr:AAA family ATPase [Bacillota bacterium]HNZ08728.1 AAA family ATPase [Bacillota bacterium]HOH10440.1 AAA family ATPase [Bacillota bacterium]HOY88793.1 AAA family ATPase [Bacillota bacterium]HPI01056.1 AAA family ATPase [Bacillota bacterium]